MSDWADRWKYRRRQDNWADGAVGSIKLESPDFHFTELDGVTPLEISHFVDTGDDEITLWVQQSSKSKNGFYLYYDKSTEECYDCRFDCKMRGQCVLFEAKAE